MKPMKSFATLLFIALFALGACGDRSSTPLASLPAAALAMTNVTTFAGTALSFGSTDGTGSTARFYYPAGITTDGTNIYVADTSNHIVRKIVISTGVVTFIAGTAGTYGTTDGTGAGASFNTPYGVITDGTNLYVADTSNHTIRKVVISTGVVTTFAGTAGTSGSANGTGIAATFNSPRGITTDGTNLYVADTGNNSVRQIVISTAAVTTLAAGFNSPSGITTYGTNLYVADTNNHTIRQIVISTGTVTTIAGTTGTAGSADGTGIAATFNTPQGITTDGTNLYVADTGNHTVRKVVISSGVVTTPVGSAGSAGSADGVGSGARFYNPIGITTTGITLYVADYSNHTIRKIQ
ncbi:MAG: hypothetical protein HY886_01820 [Deltaproteobacteria bacterium]|nr:hypothetical protein [Deltaproteobacteria bacterium]